MTNEIRIQFTEAFTSSGGFNFTGEITDMFSLRTLTDLKRQVNSQLAANASELADGRYFVMEWSPWQTKVVSEYPRVTEVSRHVVVYLNNQEGAAQETVS